MGCRGTVRIVILRPLSARPTICKASHALAFGPLAQAPRVVLQGQVEHPSSVHVLAQNERPAAHRASDLQASQTTELGRASQDLPSGQRAKTCQAWAGQDAEPACQEIVGDEDGHREVGGEALGRGPDGFARGAGSEDDAIDFGHDAVDFFLREGSVLFGRAFVAGGVSVPGRSGDWALHG